MPRINPAYFDAADRRIAQLVEAGLVPCIVAAWGYHLPWLGVERMKQHWRYLVARWGAIRSSGAWRARQRCPTTSPNRREAGCDFQKQGWTEIGRYVRAIDPFHNL